MSASPAERRILRRLLRRPDVAGLLEDAVADGALQVEDASGALLFGAPVSDDTDRAPILADSLMLGAVRGYQAATVANWLSLAATQEMEKRALAQESLDRYKEISLLHGIAEKIVGAPDPYAVAGIVTAEANRHLPGDRGLALLLNPETGQLEIAASVGQTAHDRTAFDAGDDILGSVLARGVAEIVNDVAQDGRGIALSVPMGSVMCCPMQSNERVFGLLVVGSTGAGDYTAGDLQILGSIASQAGTAIEAVRLNREISAGTRKPADLIYAVADRPPAGVTLLLSAQHALIAIMSLAYPVLITLEAGGSRLEAASVVSISLIAMALATALQAARAGPVGSGYLAPYITSAIYLGPSLIAARNGGLAMVFGMTLLAGGIAIALSQVLRRFRKLFPPELSGVVVLMVGLSIVPVALERLAGLGGDDRVSELHEWAIGGLTLVAIVALTSLRRGRIRLYATAIGLALGYLAAGFSGEFTAATFETVVDLPLVGLPSVDHVAYRFDLVIAIPFIAAALASNIKDAGLVISSQRMNDAAWKRPDMGSVSGGLVAGGLGTIVAGAAGGVGLGVSGGSIGLAAATGVTARWVGFCVAAIFLLLALMPKVTAVLALVPFPVMGAGLIYVACHLAASGIELISSRMLDARRIYVIGLPLLAGVGLMAVPGLFDSVPEWVHAILSSPLAVTTLLALTLNAAMNLGVADTASTQLTAGAGLAEQVSRFMEQQGARWGARADVIQRATPAVIEICEELSERKFAATFTLQCQFDEFTLVQTIRPSTVDVQSIAHEDLEQLAKRSAQRFNAHVRTATHEAIEIAFEH